MARLIHHTIDRADVRRVEVWEMINLGLQRWPLERESREHDKQKSYTGIRVKLTSKLVYICRTWPITL